jgi:hypothetical protein
VPKKLLPPVNPANLPADSVERRIHLVRRLKVMLDADLAELYQAPTKRLNEAVHRNPSRFPADFMFQLTAKEAASLTSQIATSNARRGGRRYLPYAFTEHGVAMLSSVLNSDRAVQMNIVIIRAFVKLREVLAGRQELPRRLEQGDQTASTTAPRSAFWFTKSRNSSSRLSLRSGASDSSPKAKQTWLDSPARHPISPRRRPVHKIAVYAISAQRGDSIHRPQPDRLSRPRHVYGHRCHVPMLHPGGFAVPAQQAAGIVAVLAAAVQGQPDAVGLYQNCRDRPGVNLRWSDDTVLRGGHVEVAEPA